MAMNIKGDLVSGTNPNTDRPNHASSKPTWSFHERYASDAEFKRQVDDARKRSAAERGTAALQTSLDLTRGKGRKLY
jgi:hypothetical protein